MDTDPINTGVSIFPHASVIFAGAPGFTALAGHGTVLDPLAGGVNVVLKSTV